MKDIKLPTGETLTVKLRPWWLFWLAEGYTITLYPYIYTTQIIYDNEYMSVFIHENVHIKQQREGKFKFYFKYIFSRNFRYRVEFEAYLTQFRWEISQGGHPSIKWVCGQLASMPYLWCVSEDKAITDFKDALLLVNLP